KMRLAEAAATPDRETHAMQRQRTVLGNRREVAMRRTALAHIVFGMYLEETDVRPAGEELAVMLGLQAENGAQGQVVEGRHPGFLPHVSGRWPGRQHRRPGVCQSQEGMSRVSASRLPIRSPGSSIASHVPAGTSFQALP